MRLDVQGHWLKRRQCNSLGPPRPPWRVFLSLYVCTRLARLVRLQSALRRFWSAREVFQCASRRPRSSGAAQLSARRGRPAGGWHGARGRGRGRGRPAGGSTARGGGLVAERAARSIEQSARRPLPPVTGAVRPICRAVRPICRAVRPATRQPSSATRQRAFKSGPAATGACQNSSVTRELSGAPRRPRLSSACLRANCVSSSRSFNNGSLSHTSDGLQPSSG